MCGSEVLPRCLSIIARLTRVARFELGSGMFINTVLPEAVAEFLCHVKIETTGGAQQAMTAGAAECAATEDLKPET